MTLVLGIDPGTATTGYGLVRNRADGSLESVAFGTTEDSSWSGVSHNDFHRFFTK